MMLKRVVQNDMAKLARMQVQQSVRQQSYGRFQLCMENGNFYCHERLECFESPLRQKLSWFE